MTTNTFTKLQGLLKELFQIESAADLDFGIYRIMNQKRVEVERFIEEGLAGLG
jgi:adenine-specific DNA-methyltransferase